MKNVSNLKTVYTEQLHKLQHKHSHECELLEDMRLFTKQRSVIEKEYAQALSKLAQQFISKRTPIPPPSLASQEGNKEQRTMHEVWQTLLEETDKVGKTRLQASEIYSQQISDSCKVVRGLKVHVAKKVFENLMEVQKDLSLGIQELVKLQKAYKEEEHIAHDARVKANEAEDKVKKKSVGLFTSFSKLQQQSAKLNSRKEACENKSTCARNEYLLCLSSINAQLNRYYNKDAPELIKAMDGEIYEKMGEYFTAFCQAELQSCGTTQECFMRILADSTKVNRDFQLRGFLVDNPIFTHLIQYQFQPQDNDLIGKVSISYQNSSVMELEARKCAGKLVQVDREARVMTRKMNNSLKEHTDADHNTEDPHIKAEEMKQLIRKAEIEKVRMEARLEAIKHAGINTEAFILNAKAESKTPEDEDEPALTTPLTTPQHTNGVVTTTTTTTTGVVTTTGADASEESSPVKRQSFKQSTTSNRHSTTITNNNTEAVATFTNNNLVDDNTQQQQTDVLANGWKDEEQPATQMEKQEAYINDSNNNTTSLDNSTEQQQYDVVVVEEVGQSSLALYSFQATGEGELDIVEGDLLETLGGVEDGWIRARDNTGKVGLVPAAYIQIGSTTPPQQDDATTQQQDITTTQQQHNTVDAFEDPWNEMNGNVQHEQSANNSTTTTQEATTTNNTHDPDDPYSNTDFEVQDTFTQPLPLPTSDKVWARALYDYYATNDEELTFNEGQLIQVLRKELHDGVDDGWWEGEVNGKLGVFPSLVVQEEDGVVNGADDDDDDDDEEEFVEEIHTSIASRPGPPQHAPPVPDVIENGDVFQTTTSSTTTTPSQATKASNAEVCNGDVVVPNGVGKPGVKAVEKVVEKPKDIKAKDSFDFERPPTPPPPLEQAPQLEITIPTPTEGGKTSSELLQAHSLACSG